MSDGTGRFRIVADGHYHIAFPNWGIEFTVDRLRRERNELHCELSVACGLVGAKAIDGVLSVGTFNLSSPVAAQQRAKLLAERARAKGLDWLALLEEVRQRILAAERTGEPSISLRDVRVPPDDGEYEVLGLRFPREHLTIDFGDGGSLKSYLLLLKLVTLASQGIRVGLFDWELDQVTHRRRLEQLCGHELPDIRYAHCDRPLTHEIDRLRRIIRTDQLAYVGLDSVGYGTAGAPEAAEAALDYCRAVRQLGVGAGALAHVSKAENGDQRPFGSAFWHNSARSTWNIKLAAPIARHTLQLAAFNRKTTLSHLSLPVGLQAQFADDRLTFTRIDVATIEGMADALPLWQRIRSHVQPGARTIAEIAEALDAKPDTVKKALERKPGTFTCLTNTPDGIHRWGLIQGGRA